MSGGAVRFAGKSIPNILIRYSKTDNSTESPLAKRISGMVSFHRPYRIRWPSWYGFGLIPLVVLVRALAWVGTSSAFDLSNGRAGWVVIVEYVVITENHNHRATPWFKKSKNVSGVWLLGRQVDSSDCARSRHVMGMYCLGL